MNKRLPIGFTAFACLCVWPGALVPQTPIILPIDDPEAAASHRVVWPTEPGIQYELRQSTDLVEWTTVAGFPGEAEGGSMEHAFVIEDGRLFFRVHKFGAPEGFALIPAGDFEMGDHFVEGWHEELPVRTVYVSAFYMGRTPVTKAQWDGVRAWAVNKGYTDLPAGDGKGPDHPVQRVSWFDAVKWLNAWSEKDSLAPVYSVNGSVMRTGSAEPAINYTANGYRLPTEAEWEKAARGGLHGKRFPWGETISHDNANYRANGLAYIYDVSPYESFRYYPYSFDRTIPYTSPVGSFAANGYGLHDMAGNVSEWCNDWWSNLYHSLSPGIDPRGPSSGVLRVVRGGSWNLSAFNTRVSYRYSYYPDYGWTNYGFRPARTASP